MKDKIPTSEHRFYKPKFLQRLVRREEKRIEIFKQLVSQGMYASKAYETSIRRLRL
tara:strand:- start:154 stop:321 length:168 start_codon:yes stop_codon:yes gene_type:complete